MKPSIFKPLSCVDDRVINRYDSISELMRFSNATGSCFELVAHTLDDVDTLFVVEYSNDDCDDITCDASYIFASDNIARVFSCELTDEFKYDGNESLIRTHFFALIDSLLRD